MRIGAFEIHEPVPELREPHAITMVRPWVDVGSAVSIALARLEGHLGVTELGKLARPGNYFDFTRYRPKMRMVEGRREVSVPNSVINYTQPEEGPALMFFHLREPHASSEEYTDSVLQVFEHFGVRRYCRLGAMYDVVPHTRPLIVTGDAGNVPMRSGAKLRPRKSTYQGPTSIMNLISEGVPKMEPEIISVSFMVHLPQYLQLDEDYAGAARLLDVLSAMYDVPQGLLPPEQGQRQYKELDSAVERNSELKALIGRLESQYDAERASEETDPPAPLSPEVERFLEEMDHRFTDPGQRE